MTRDRSCCHTAGPSTPQDSRSKECLSRCIAFLSWQLWIRWGPLVWQFRPCTWKHWHSSCLCGRSWASAGLSVLSPSEWKSSKSSPRQSWSWTIGGGLSSGRGLHRLRTPWWCSRTFHPPRRPPCKPPHSGAKSTPIFVLRSKRSVSPSGIEGLSSPTIEWMNKWENRIIVWNS